MDEYIKREDVLTAFEGADADVMADYGDWAEWGFSLTKIKEVIQAVPVEYVGELVKARRGHWIWNSEYCKWECSECGGREPDCEPPFCKWCGADMREAD